MAIIRILTFALISLTLAVHAISQPTELGIAGGGAINLHSASFTQLGPYASCCPEFSGGNGLGGWIGLGVTKPLSNTWRLGASLVYASQNGTMVYNEASFVADLRDTPRVREAVFKHELTSTIQSIGLEPRILFRAVGALDISLGMRIAYVTTAHFMQQETLEQPDDYGAYLGAGRTWVNHNADIPDASSLFAGVIGGARYSLPLNRSNTWLLQPEVAVIAPLSSVTSVASWSITDIRFGIGIAKAFVSDTAHIDTTSQPPIIPTTAPEAPIVVVPDPPNATLTLQGLVNGHVVPFDTVRIEETRIVDFLPVLPYVFFDKNSTSTSERFVHQAQLLHSGQDVSTDNQAVVSVLGIVAQRTISRPNATITLTGCALDEEVTLNNNVAQQRAESIRSELIKLGVPSKQIRVKARKMPASPTLASNPTDQILANEENQRVEISPSDPEILAPIVISNTVRDIQPDTLVATVDATIPAGAARWKSHPVIKEVPTPTVWRAVHTYPAPTSTDSAFIEVVDSLGRVASDQTAIPVSTLTVERKLTERRNDAEVERYSLILFGFDDATVTDLHRVVLSRIRSKVNEGAQIRILGMTDAMGSDSYNMNLSKRRADEVAKVLGLDTDVTQALGATSPRFDNTTPEGRSYNRTVIIEVRQKKP